jgi:hypothetical protein
MQQLPCVDDQLYMHNRQDEVVAMDHDKQLAPVHCHGTLPCPEQDYECTQLLPLSAQNAAAALRKSMEQLHRAKGLECLSHVWHATVKQSGGSSVSSSVSSSISDSNNSKTLHSRLQQELDDSGACTPQHSPPAADGAVDPGMEVALPSVVAGGSCMRALHDLVQSTLTSSTAEQQLLKQSPCSLPQPQSLTQRHNDGSFCEPADGACGSLAQDQEQHKLILLASGVGAEPGQFQQAVVQNEIVVEGYQQGGPTLDSLLAEAQQLNALRHALRAELEAMGNDRLAAAMGPPARQSSARPDQQDVQVLVEHTQEPNAPLKHCEDLLWHQLPEAAESDGVQHQPLWQQQQQQPKQDVACDACNMPLQPHLPKQVEQHDHAAAFVTSELRLESQPHWQQQPRQAPTCNPCSLPKQQEASSSSMCTDVMQQQLEIDCSRHQQSPDIAHIMKLAPQINTDPLAEQVASSDNAERQQHLQQQLPQQQLDTCGASCIAEDDAVMVEHASAGATDTDLCDGSTTLTSLQDSLVQHMTCVSPAAHTDFTACSMSLAEGDDAQATDQTPFYTDTNNNMSNNMSLSFSFGKLSVVPGNSQPAVTHMLVSPSGNAALRLSVNNPLFQADDADGNTDWQQGMHESPVQHQVTAAQSQTQQGQQQQWHPFDAEVPVQPLPQAPVEVQPQMDWRTAGQQLPGILHSPGGQPFKAFASLISPRDPQPQVRASSVVDGAVEGAHSEAGSMVDLAIVEPGGQQLLVVKDMLLGPHAAQPVLLGPCLPLTRESQEQCSNLQRGGSALIVPAAPALLYKGQGPDGGKTDVLQQVDLPLQGALNVSSGITPASSSKHAPDCMELPGVAATAGACHRLSTARNPKSRKPQVACGLQADEGPPVNQGSYVVAALQAKLRLEREQAEQQELQAAAAAAKHAAASKLAEEKLTAQAAAAEKATRQKVLVACGNYAHVGSCSAAEAPAMQAPAVPAMQASSACGAAHGRKGWPGRVEEGNQRKQQQQNEKQVEHARLLDAFQAPTKLQHMVPHLVPSCHAGVKPAAGSTGASNDVQSVAGSASRGELHSATQAASSDHQGGGQRHCISRQRSGPAAGAEQLFRAACSQLVSSTPVSRIPSAPGTPGGAAGLAMATPQLNTASTAAGSGLELQDGDCEFLERVNDLEVDAVIVLPSPAAAEWPALNHRPSRSQGGHPAAGGREHPPGRPSSQQGMWAAVQAAATAAVRKQAAATAPVSPMADPATNTAPAELSPFPTPAAAGAGDKVTLLAAFARTGAAVARGGLSAGSSSKPRGAGPTGITGPSLSRGGSASTLQSKGGSMLGGVQPHACTGCAAANCITLAAL